MARKKTPKDNLTLEAWDRLGDAGQLVRYLRRQTCWLNGIGRMFLLMHMAERPLADCVVDAVEKSLANGDAQAYALLERWQEAIVVADSYTALSEKRHEVLGLPTSDRDRRADAGPSFAEANDFWEYGEDGKAYFYPNVLPTDWQRARLRQIREIDELTSAGEALIRPAYHAFKDAAETWFVQTQSEKARKEFESAERISRESRLLREILIPDVLDENAYTEEEKETNALADSMPDNALAECVTLLEDAVEWAEEHGTNDGPLDLPPLAAATQNALPPLRWDDWEHLQRAFWTALDNGDETTRDAEAAWGLVIEVADHTVYVFRQEAHGLQAQGVGEAEAAELAGKLPEVRQLVKTALVLTDRFFTGIWNWFNARHPEDGMKLHQSAAERDLKNQVSRQRILEADRRKPVEAGTERQGRALKAANYSIRTSQEIDVLLRSAADGRTGRHWETDSHERTRVHRVTGLSHIVRMGLTDEEIAEGISVEALERFTFNQDADCVLAILYVCHLLSPPSPLPQNAAPVGWVDLDDVAQKIGWTARSTAERARNRARIWNYLNFGARAVVSGKRSTTYRDRHTGAIIPTEIEGPIWAFHEREHPAQASAAASASVPLRVEIAMSRIWSRLLSEPQTAQYLPLGELLGSIPGDQPSGAWARCLGMALANLWRQRPEGALDGSLRPTRHSLLTHYTPKKAVPQEVLNGHDPARARTYWRQALGILTSLKFLADAGEGAWKATPCNPMQRKNWQKEWLNERVALYPGPNMLPSLETLAKARPQSRQRRSGPAGT